MINGLGADVLEEGDPKPVMQDDPAPEVLVIADIDPALQGPGMLQFVFREKAFRTRAPGFSRIKPVKCAVKSELQRIVLFR